MSIRASVRLLVPTLMAAASAFVINADVVSAATPLTPGPPSVSRAGYDDVAADLQGGPLHDGHSSTKLVASPTLLWAQLPGQLRAAPLIADGRVFVIVAKVGYPDELRAYSLRTGLLLWGPRTISPRYARGATYDLGRVFTVQDDGTTQAWDAVTGIALWSAKPAFEATDLSAPPTARDGRLFIGAPASLFAVDEVTGRTLWHQQVAYGDESAPSVTADVVVVNYACDNSYAFVPATGERLWSYGRGGCGGGGGATVPIHNGLAHLRQPPGLEQTHMVLDLRTGAVVREESRYYGMPAFDAARQFRVDGWPTAVQALDDATGQAQWTSAAHDYGPPPLTVDGRLFAVATDGRVDALDQTTGQLTWSGPRVLRDLTSAQSGLNVPGLAAAQGVLVVSVGDELRAYGDPASLLAR